ncbi:AbrB family transcriptional regulator [Gordoniibacillus kamchatkensis]|uniref:AbrB family transcriptional regulator n=1 Tax=Gordoniibacillus kamchatkensis TaxID=1590651 RepID=UPI001E31CEB5|nr:AbrB family transcriptional regulator [Paenibacillus sp. VKM B-2647]
MVNLSGFHGPALPTPLLNASQFMIGSYVGLLLQPGQLERKARTITLAFGGGAVLIAGSLWFSTIVSRIHSISLPTSFLSLAPGGMDQMGIMAHEVGG